LFFVEPVSVYEILFVIHGKIFAILEKILRPKFIGQTPETDLGNSLTTVQKIFWDFKTGKFLQVSAEIFSKISKLKGQLSIETGLEVCCGWVRVFINRDKGKFVGDKPV
jgi:hypothetical protein